MERTKQFHYGLPIIRLGQIPYETRWAVVTTLDTRHQAFKEGVFKHLSTMSPASLSDFSCLGQQGIKALQCYLDQAGANEEIRLSMTDENFEQLCQYEAQIRGHHWHISSRGTGEVRCHWDETGYTAMQEDLVFVIEEGDWSIREDLYEEINSQEMLNFLKSIGASEGDAFWMYQLY